MRMHESESYVCHPPVTRLHGREGGEGEENHTAVAELLLSRLLHQYTAKRFCTRSCVPCVCLCACMRVCVRVHVGVFMCVLPSNPCPSMHVPSLFGKPARDLISALQLRQRTAADVPHNMASNVRVVLS